MRYTKRYLTDIASFIPEDFLAAELSKELPKNRDAAVLLVDIAGFTHLAESLARSGKRGAEELSSILNGFFSKAIMAAARRGGSVASFGGDSIAVHFYAPSDSGGGVAALLAGARTALALIRLASEFSRETGNVSGYSLNITTILAYGNVERVIFEGTDHKNIAYDGEVFKELLLLEKTAPPNRVIIGKSTLTRLRDFVEIDESEDNIVLRSVKGSAGAGLPRVRRTLVRSMLRKTPRNEVEHVTKKIEPFLHRRICDKVRSRSGLAENRFATVIFVECDDETLRETRKTYECATDYISRYGGYIDKATRTISGWQLMCVFGAPFSFENEVKHAYELGLRLAETEPKPKVGITSGLVYAGITGSSIRREYTVIGDAVNLASRLAETAPSGTAYTDAPLLRQLREVFEPEEIGTIAARGRDEPVEVRKLIRAGARPIISKPPLIGREKELKRLRGIITGLKEYEPAGCELVGDAGMGKSTLLSELSEWSEKRGMKVISTGSEEMTSRTPYSMWAELVIRALNLPGDVPETQMREVLENAAALVDQAGELRRRIPYLGAMLFSIDYSDTLYADVTPDIRVENLTAGLNELIRIIGAREPLLIIFDDYQYVDSASRELLPRVFAGHLPRGCAVVISRRPRQLEPIEWPAAIEPETIRLGALNRSGVHQIISYRAGYKKYPETLLDEVYSRSGANPFYVDELVNGLIERGLLVERGDAWELTAPAIDLDLPGSLSTAILSRIDRLDPSRQLALNCASVIGVKFALNTAARLHGRKSARRDYNELTEKDILLPLMDEEFDFTFKHGLTRDVSYNTMLHSRRSELHFRLAGLMAAAPPEETDRKYPVIAYHYEMGENTEKAAEYYTLAARTAASAYANKAAEEFYLKALLWIDSIEMKLKLMQELIKVYEIDGRYEKAYGVLDNARELTGDYKLLVKLYLGTCRVYAQQARIDDVERLLNEIEEHTDDLPGAKVDVLHQRAIILQKKGKLKESIAKAEECLGICREHDLESQAHSVKQSIGISLAMSGDFRKALDYFLDIHDYFQKNEDRLTITRNLVSIGNCHNLLGHYEKGEYWYKHYIEKSNEIGYRRGESMGLGNLVDLYYTIGELDKALTQNKRRLEVAHSLGDFFGLSHSLVKAANIHFIQGDYDEAVHRLADAETHANRIKQADILSDIRTAKAEIAFELLNIDEAGSWLSKGYEEVSGTGLGRHIADNRMKCARISSWSGDADETARYVSELSEVIDVNRDPLYDGYITATSLVSNAADGNLSTAADQLEKAFSLRTNINAFSFDLYLLDCWCDAVSLSGVFIGDYDKTTLLDFDKISMYKPPLADWTYLEYSNATNKGRMDRAGDLKAQYLAICEEIGSKRRAGRRIISRVIN